MSAVRATRGFFRTAELPSSIVLSAMIAANGSKMFYPVARGTTHRVVFDPN
jgi:hypothetical protein